jgi:hypothetical protein
MYGKFQSDKLHTIEKSMRRKPAQGQKVMISYASIPFRCHKQLLQDTLRSVLRKSTISIRAVTRRNLSLENKIKSASIPVVVPIIISIVMVLMMVPVPAVPPIFVRVSIVAVSVVTIVIGPDLLVPRIYVNSKSIICFGFGGG